MLKAKRNRMGRTCVEGLEERVLFATFTVTTNADTGVGSLRQAIIDANTATAQQDTINFTLPGGSLTITPQTALPALTDPAGVILDASTQAGFTNGAPVVTLVSTALDVQGGNNTINGFVFQGGSISTSGAGANTIVGNNFLGTSAQRIRILAPGDRVGAAGLGGRNVINGGTTYGIFIDADNAVIENNNIGTDAAGTAAAANATGINANDVTGLTILNNLISGNTSAGIDFLGGTGITIQGNLIGTTTTGTAALGNGGAGISFNGGTADVTNNVISANSVGINGSAAGTVQGNKIGTDINGTVDLGNTADGITFGDSFPDIVDNVISGNGDDGISLALIAGGGLIQGNRIGTNDAGTGALPNGGDGIIVETAGAAVTIDDNLISANGATGITLDLGGPAVIQGNRIGTNDAGGADLGNTGNGIVITGATVGATVQDNVISGNGGTGIDIAGNTSSTTVINNRIGTDDAGTVDLGNDGPGITIRPGTVGTPTNNTIGGITTGTSNVIAFNGAAGVTISGAATGNRINGNSIFSNTGIGIDLTAGSAGRTANDIGDGDTGANNLQNFPVITQAISAAGVTTISGFLNSTASTVFRIEFFSDTGTDVNAVEGRTFLGFVDVTTNSSGQASFAAPVTGNQPVGRLLTATATSAAGNTSEFSDATQAGITGPDIEVRGNNVVIVDGVATSGTADFTDFGSTAIGTPITRTFSIFNTGQGSLDLSTGGEITITGPGASQFDITDSPNATVTGSQGTAFTISFNPTAAGNQTATVTIISNDADETPFTFVISGQGTSAALLPEIEVSGGGVPIPSGDADPITADLTNFGNGIIGGATPVTRTFTIANAGQAALTLGAVTLTGANADQFAIATQPASTSLAPGATTTFSVRFNPVAGSPFNATVNIANNDANESPYTFGITGQGVAGAGLPPSGALVDPQPSPSAGSTVYDLIVRYTDDRGFSASTFDNNDVVVTGPNGFSQVAQVIATSGDSTQFDVTYRITAPGGTIDAADNGTYTATLVAGEIIDIDGNTAPAGSLGTFAFAIENRTSAGQFGIVSGKKTRLSFIEADNTVVTITLTGGTGEVFKTANGRFDLELTATNGKATITTRGGNGRAEMNNVRVTGGLKSLVAKTADMTGVLVSTGPLSAITLGSTSGVTISTPSPITSLTILGLMFNTQVFSGAILGADARFGGTGGDADTAFGGGEIRKLNVGGAVTNSLIAAGFDPQDGSLLNGNGIIVGGAASRIGAIRVGGAVDQATVFTAGAFPKRVRFGNLTIIPTSDARFDTTA